MSKEAMKLALETLNSVSPRHLTPLISNARTALREALAEQPAQQQEPVEDEARCPECGYLTKHTEHIGCMRKNLNAINDFERRNFAIVNMDKFPPAQRKPLTNAQIMAIGKEMGSKCRLGGNPNIDFDYARAIEAAHGIKENT